MLLGQAVVVEGDDSKGTALKAFMDWRGFTTVQSYSPRRLTADEEAALAAVIIGRWQELRPPTKHEIKATTILGMDLGEVSATRAGCVTGGGAGASVPPGRVKSATSGPTSSPPCARTPATTSPW